MSEGVPVIVGNTVPASTVTVKFTDAALPYASVDLQVTVLRPIAKVAPGAGVQFTSIGVLYWSSAIGAL
jgi:hypothetical protein